MRSTLTESPSLAYLARLFAYDPNAAIPPGRMIAAVLLSAALGAAVWFVYYSGYVKNRRSVMYSSTFGLSLLAMTMMTTAVLLAIGSRVGLSLGMVGALSIVRFRAAIKEPIEIVFLFWAIETGVLLASGILWLALLANVFIGTLIWLLIRTPVNQRVYMLVIRGDCASVGETGTEPNAPTGMDDSTEGRGGADGGTEGRDDADGGAGRQGSFPARMSKEPASGSRPPRRSMAQEVKNYLFRQRELGIADIDLVTETWPTSGRADDAHTERDSANPGASGGSGIGSSFELVYEIRMKQKASGDAICDEVRNRFPVRSVSLIRANGDYV